MSQFTRNIVNVSPASPYFDDLDLNFRIQGIDLFLQGDGALNGCHHTAIGFDLFQAEHPVPAVLEPLCQHLIAADLVLPQFEGNRLEILTGVRDVHWIMS